MATTDLVQLLEMVGAVVSHPALTPDSLKSARAQIKAAIADKAWLQDPEILSRVDRILQYGTAAQVPASFVATGYNPADYVDPAPEKKEAPPPEPAKPHAPPEKHR